MADAPPTDEGWFVIHDFREVDWPAWRDAPERERDRAIEEATDLLASAHDTEDGETAIFAVTGHKADLLVMHLRPTLDAIEHLERRFEQTAFGRFTTQTTSYVSVTEIGGYTAPEYFEDPESVDEGLRRYMESKKYPSIPEDVYVSFYPMSKRRDPEYNWYDTPIDERAEMMDEHGETGKSYAGKVTQIVSSSLGLDDWEWGVTLFGTEATHLKDIVYEMRFDEATAKYGEFGSFYVGRRLPVADLGAYMAGEAVPTGTDTADEAGHAHAGADHEHDETGHPHDEGDDHPHDEEAGDLRDRLADLDVYGGTPRGEDVYALALYSEADPDELAAEVSGLRSNFEHYDTHVTTGVYEPRTDGPAAVVSVWETQSAADTASGFLSELPGIVGRPADAEGWTTMGMFYTVEPEHREDFLAAFDDVREMLLGMDGHRETSLLVDREDETDMFIASRWDSREDAMEFFRSEEFSEAVAFGREVLADRPRHVFLA